MPLQSGSLDYVNWVLYDRNTTAAGANTATQYTFFNVPIGSGGKTKNDTNMDQVMVLPAPEYMNVTHWGFYFSSDMFKVDLDTFLKNYWAEFWVGNKIYSEGPLVCFPSGSGFSGFDTRTNEAAVTLGNPQGQAVMFDLRLPAGIINDPKCNGLFGIEILQGENFKVVLNGTAFALAAGPAPGLNLMAFLYGQKSRGVR